MHKILLLTTLAAVAVVSAGITYKPKPMVRA